MNLEPVTSGYPVLLVDGSFAIRATNRGLNESYSGETGTNFNPTTPAPTGIPYEFHNALCNPTDTVANDVYPSEIQGLVAVSGSLTFTNQPRVRGQVIAGSTITGAPSPGTALRCPSIRRPSSPRSLPTNAAPGRPQAARPPPVVGP